MLNSVWFYLYGSLEKEKLQYYSLDIMVMMAVINIYQNSKNVHL